MKPYFFFGLIFFCYLFAPSSAHISFQDLASHLDISLDEFFEIIEEVDYQFHNDSIPPQATELDIDPRVWALLQNDEASYRTKVRCEIGMEIVRHVLKAEACGPSGNITCLNGGVCIDDRCVCPMFFAGRDCRFDVRGVNTLVSFKEIQGLVNFYDALHGDAWNCNNNWVSEIDPCTNTTAGIGTISGVISGLVCMSRSTGWYGVTCNAGMTRVTGLLLEANGLMGTIPDDFFDYFPSMSFFDAEKTLLAGTLPESMRRATEMTELFLPLNFLGGSLDVLDNLPNMNTLDVKANCFLGRMPAVNNSTRLVKMVGQANYLSGEVSSDYALRDWDSLAFFWNYLDGIFPVRLYKARSQSLDIVFFGNSFTCPVPPSMDLMPCHNANFTILEVIPRTSLVNSNGPLLVISNITFASEVAEYGNIYARIEIYNGVSRDELASFTGSPSRVVYTQVLSIGAPQALGVGLTVNSEAGVATLTLMQRHEDFEEEFTPWTGNSVMYEYVRCDSGYFSPQYDVDVDFASISSLEELRQLEVTCSICPPGHYCDGVAQYPCFSDTYLPYTGASSSTQCTSCPQSSKTEGTGSVQRADCSCFEGYYGNLANEDEECRLCPKGGTCVDGMLYASHGYFLVPWKNRVVPCDDSDHCLGSIIPLSDEESTVESDAGDVSETDTPPTTSGGTGSGFSLTEEDTTVMSRLTPTSEENTTLSDDESMKCGEWSPEGNCCIEHHQGWLCDTCDPGYAPFSHVCSVCPPMGASVISVALHCFWWLLLFAMAEYLSLSKRFRPGVVAVIRMFLSHVQIQTVIMLSYSASLPHELDMMQRVLGTLSTPSRQSLPFFYCFSDDRDGRPLYDYYIYTMVLPWATVTAVLLLFFGGPHFAV
eukprot:Rmarinus@m.9049